jgi:phosphatidylserine decarboxylase
MMTPRALIAMLTQQEDLNFLLTNRIPRKIATRFMGWFSRVEQPLIRDLSIGIWRLFSELDLSDARKTEFVSLHDCFIRELEEGAREIDPDPMIAVSPCDAIVGASGSIADTELLQVKGFPYRLHDLVPDRRFEEEYRNGRYVTLRLTSGMYHRFHAPHDCVVDQVDYMSGDTWNVNPIALKRIEKLYCKNERAAIRARLSAGGHVLTLVPVAAILVASIRLHFLQATLRAAGVNRFRCRAPFRKGGEMGWFEHGSTIIVFAPDGFELTPNVQEGRRIRMGEPLLHLPGVPAMSTGQGSQAPR